MADGSPVSFDIQAATPLRRVSRSRQAPHSLHRAATGQHHQRPASGRTARSNRDNGCLLVPALPSDHLRPRAANPPTDYAVQNVDSAEDFRSHRRLRIGNCAGSNPAAKGSSPRTGNDRIRVNDVDRARLKILVDCVKNSCTARPPPPAYWEAPEISRITIHLRRTDRMEWDQVLRELDCVDGTRKAGRSSIGAAAVESRAPGDFFFGAESVDSLTVWITPRWRPTTRLSRARVRSPGCACAGDAGPAQFRLTHRSAVVSHVLNELAPPALNRCAHSSPVRPPSFWVEPRHA